MPRVTRVEAADAPAASAQTATLSGVQASKPFDHDISADGQRLTTVDRLKRKLAFRKPSSLDKNRLQIAVTMAYNAEVAKNEDVMMTYSIAAALESINGVAEQPWATLRDLDFRVQTLGDEGMLASSLAYPLLFKGLSDQEVKDIAKKFQTTPK